MLQMLKSAVSQTIKLQVAVIKGFLKLCIAILKVLLVTVMFAAMVFGTLSAFVAVGPMHTPTWMLPAWNALNGIDPARLMDALSKEPSPLWEVHDSSIAISRWAAQFLPVADLMATAAGLAREHWLRTEVEVSIQHMNALMKSEPKVGQALCVAWIVSTLSIMFLVVQTVIGTAKFLGSCVRKVLRATCPAHGSTAEAAAEPVLPDGSGPTPKVDLSKTMSHALTENTHGNINATTMMTSEKKGGNRRLESPAIRKPNVTTTENVPPFVASPLKRKQSELNELRQAGLVARRLRGK